MPVRTRLPAKVGVGYKPEHFDALSGVGLLGAASTKPGFLEVHAENYMTDGGWPHWQLETLRRDYALSIHGVALSLGGVESLDRDHLRRLKILCDRYQPESFSEHLAWTSHGGFYLSDLLPLPYTEERLALVAAHVDATQDYLQRKILIENPATYVAFAASVIPETEFLAELVRRTGCGLLLDVNNVHVCAQNHDFDARDYLRAFPFAAVEEIHLAGHEESRDAQAAPFLIDSHGTPIADTVFALYAEVLTATGPQPSLIERDNNIPAWHELEAELRQAADILAAARSGAKRPAFRAA